ncbi:MAG: hypothetical protein V1855_01325 [bacterium]
MKKNYRLSIAFLFVFFSFPSSFFNQPDLTNFYTQKNYEIVLTGPCVAEKTVEAFRLTQARTTLETILNITIPTIDEVPRIAVVCSGGGMRAAIVTLAALQALEKQKLLDAVTYIAGVSGATWTIASWLVHNCSLEDLKEIIKNELCDTHNTKDLLSIIFSQALKKTLPDKQTRPRNLVDYWGMFLAKIFFATKNNPEGTITLSALAPTISYKNYPIPLLTAVIAPDQDISTDDYKKLEKASFDVVSAYRWIEFSPLRINIPRLNKWILPHAFGSQFESNNFLSPLQEEELGYLIGICGSAFALTVNDVLDNITIPEPKVIMKQLKKWGIKKETVDLLDTWGLFKSEWIKGVIKTALGAILKTWSKKSENTRFINPKVPNFLYDTSTPSTLSKNKHLSLVDAGISNNIPFPPLMRKGIDVYIAVDSNINQDQAMSPIVRAQKYAEKNSLPFPTFNYKNIKKKQFSIIKDDKNKNAPIIIYIQNPTEFSTMKFDCTDKEFDTLYNKIQTIITGKKNFKTLKNALKVACNKKRLSLKKDSHKRCLHSLNH